MPWDKEIATWLDTHRTGPPKALDLVGMILSEETVNLMLQDQERLMNEINLAAWKEWCAMNVDLGPPGPDDDGPDDAADHAETMRDLASWLREAGMMKSTYGSKIEGEPNLTRARKYAAVVHGAQTYNDEVPYTDHLDMAWEVLNRFGLGADQTMGSAIYLHDAIEDTRTSYNDIQTRFGTEVAELVYAVTSELGRNRAERNGKTYAKIASSSRSVILKLADRIANVQYGQATPGGKVEMYKKEYASFRQALHPSTSPTRNDRSGLLQDKDPLPTEMRMWELLDRLLEFKGA